MLKCTSLILAMGLALSAAGAAHADAAAAASKTGVKDSGCLLEKNMPGKLIAFDRSKGNCLACHAMPSQPDAVAAGTIGPALINMKLRYPDKAVLREHIYDEMRFNPNTAMPPFGLNKILTPHEIDEVTDFIYGL